MAQMVKNPPAMQETWVGKIPWRRAWQPPQVFLPGESHGQGSLVGYSPRGHKEWDTTEPLSTRQDGFILTYDSTKCPIYKQSPILRLQVGMNLGEYYSTQELPRWH